MKQFVNYGRTWEELLKRAGVPYKKRSTGVFVISCIFHDEKTPSLHCWPSGNFYCHGCAENGNIRRFMKELLDVSDDLEDHKWNTIACYIFLPGELDQVMGELYQRAMCDIPTFPQGGVYEEYAQLCTTHWRDLNIG